MKAEVKRVEKAQKEARKGLKCKRVQCKQPKQVETSLSEDSNAIEYNELSEYSSKAEGNNFYNEGMSAERGLLGSSVGGLSDVIRSTANIGTILNAWILM